MNSPQATLAERAAYLYRRLLLLQRLFEPIEGTDTVDWFAAADETEALALRAGIRELLDDLGRQARVLTTVPSPLREWRPGDGPDDERWRALTEVERREVLSLVSSYEALIAWVEGQSGQHGDADGSDLVVAIRKPPRDARGTTEYLRSERARLTRFRQDMGFLDRRRAAETD
jgi:hypothetical protein